MPRSTWKRSRRLDQVRSPSIGKPVGNAPPGESGATYRAEVVAAMDEVPAADWNRLAGAHNPFVRHEFLSALERHGCVGTDSGWMPRHLVLYRDQTLVGAMPMYLKAHSYGEFVFDWGWAEAYSRAGLDYYPKLLVAVPFTPAAGPRLLIGAEPSDDDIRRMLIGAAVTVARRSEVSSLHWLFANHEDHEALASSDLLIRSGHQFHWQNPGYRDFQDYLDALTSKRRKQIRRERREAASAPVDIEVLTGESASAEQWNAYHRLYASTYDRKWGYPSLTPAFFREVGRTMADSILLVLARRRGRYVAGAHFFIGIDTLFGRNWGCTEFHPSLHFEMCYYRAIELCIERRLARFEAGAQGEHKITRGFLPVATHSAHWIRHDGFRRAIEDFLREERRNTERYIAAAARHTPFKSVIAGSG